MPCFQEVSATAHTANNLIRRAVFLITAYPAVHCGVLVRGCSFLSVGHVNKVYNNNSRTEDNLQKITPTVIFSVSPAQFQRVINKVDACLSSKKINSNTTFKRVN